MKKTQIVISRPDREEGLRGVFSWPVAVVEFRGRKRVKVGRARGGFATTEARANARIQTTVTEFIADLPEGVEVVDGG